MHRSSWLVFAILLGTVFSAVAVAPSIAVDQASSEVVEVAADDSRAVTTSSIGRCLPVPEPIAPDLLSRTEVPSFARWLHEPRAQADAKRVQEVVTASSVSTLGSYIDWENERIVVVVGGPQDQPWEGEFLSQELAASVAGDLSVHVEAGCRSRADLHEVMERVVERDWDATAHDVSMLVDLDPASSAVVVHLSEKDTEHAAALVREFGAAVRVVIDEEFGRGAGSRLNDTSPHYGGARITNGGGCTTGHAVDRNGGRWMTTAGHCVTAQGEIVRNGNGTNIGTVNVRSIDPDIAIFGSGSRQYSRQLWVDPCCPSVRLTTAKVVNPWNGMGTCSSGSFTRALCGQTVNNNGGATLCDSLGCTTGLWRTRRGGDVIIQGGDSGGPIYGRSGSSNASARGFIVGFADSRTSILFHDVGRIERARQVAVATTCCNSTSW